MNIINTSVQYDDTSLPSSCTDLQIPSYDGLPRIPLEQSLLRNNWEQSYFNYNISAPEMSSSDASSAWPMSSETGNSNQYYSYDAGNYEPSLSRDQFGETPRTLPCDGDMYSNGNMSSKVVYEIPSYLVEVDRQGLVDHGLNYSQDAHESSRRFGRPSALAENDVMAQVSFSEHPATSLNPQSESSDDGGHSSRETTAVEAEEHGADEPYAKLIYRALMSVPDHSMVLQDIYQWFRENTTKGSSDTKGWMNSIRHNLSMNAVSSFRVTNCAKADNVRLSRKLNVRFLVTRSKSQRNGFWKTSRSETVFNLQRDIAKGMAVKSLLNTTLKFLADRYLVVEAVCVEARPKTTGKERERTAQNFVTLPIPDPILKDAFSITQTTSLFHSSSQQGKSHP